MRFVVLFEDALDPATLDAALNRAHFAYLAGLADRIVLAGGLRADQGAPYCGALWVVEAPDRAAAARLVADDPYTISGLRPAWRIFAWGKAPHLGAVTL
jgi:uncharacterized protein YciI